jgi:DNA topoisomerase-1
MVKNIVIIESPNKKAKIEKYLKQSKLPGTYIVVATVGHVLNLEKSSNAVDTANNYAPVWKVMPDKTKVVKDLKAKVKGADHVFIATDPDLAGEFIGWSVLHLCKLQETDYNRVTFNAITLDTIVKGFKHTEVTNRKINMNKVYAEQTRRILDRLIGFSLSPLVIKVVSGKSAGRCQSPVAKLIYEKDKEIESFVSKSKFTMAGDFVYQGTTISTTLNKPFVGDSGVEKFFDILKTTQSFSIYSVKKTEHQKKPSLPYKTSTLLSDVSSKTGWSVKSITSGLQALFTQGHITYIRTKSTRIDESAISVIETSIATVFDKTDIDKSKRKQLAMIVSDDKKEVKGKSEQEGHECIRVTNPSLECSEISNDQQRKLYVWIWKRTLASLMKPQEYDKYTVTIKIKKVKSHHFTGTIDDVQYDGFMKLYNEYDTYGQHMTISNKPEALVNVFKKLMESDEKIKVDYTSITAMETLSSPPASYSEASLITKMDSLHIGTEATYPSIVNTIIDRKYVELYSDLGKDVKLFKYTLTDGTLKKSSETKRKGAVKNKLRTTVLGQNVVTYLCNDFADIMDYEYTSNLEKDIINVEQGTRNWYDVVHKFYMQFKPIVDETNKKYKDNPNHHKKLLGEYKDLNVYVYKAKYGPVVQLGVKKPMYAKIPKGKHIDKITLEQAIVLLDEKENDSTNPHEGKELVEYNAIKYYLDIKSGQWGPYLMLSLETPPKDKIKPITISLKGYIKSLNIENPETIDMPTIRKILKLEEIHKKASMFEDHEHFSVEVKKGKSWYIQLTNKKSKKKTKPIFVSIPKTIERSNITQNQVTELILKKLAGNKK